MESDTDWRKRNDTKTTTTFNVYIYSCNGRHLNSCSFDRIILPVSVEIKPEQHFFQNQLLDLTHRLEGTSSFSDDWLANLEAEGHFIVHIEDNGTPLFFPGAWIPSTNRDFLVSLAKKEAQKEGINTNIRPYSSSLLKSSVFSFKGEHRDSYRGTVMVIATDTGFRSLVLLEETTFIYRDFLLRIAFFLILELLGILALFLVSRQVVKKAVLPIEEYHRKQNEFIAAASHELRSPLAVMQTSASAILSMPEQAPKMALFIQKECQRAGNLIKNLLLLSSGDNLPQEMQSVEIDSLLLQIFETYEPLCTSKSIKISLKLPDEFLPKVYGNYQWIYQILSIFLDNAITYGCSEKNPSIQLTATLQNKYLSVCIIDHGKGITDMQKLQIFDRFYRADKSRNDKEHSGLGLSIAKMLAEHMPIELHVLDTPDGGSTFQVDFLHIVSE